MKSLIVYLLIISTWLLVSCSSNKYIPKSNIFFEVKDSLVPNTGSVFILKMVKPEKGFKAVLTEKSDYLIITPIDAINFEVDSLVVIAPEKITPTQIDLTGKKYYPELKRTEFNAKALVYYDIKFGLQALTIPLKFRKSVGNDTINPPTVDAGVNIGFAPGWKFTRNVYKPSKNYLGKNTDQYALAIGPHFGLGVSELKKATNAPGLLSDRKRPVFTYGCYILAGFNNINVGFAIGRDCVIGDGKKNWVYQGKTWTGIIVSLDILKY